MKTVIDQRAEMLGPTNLAMQGLWPWVASSLPNLRSFTCCLLLNEALQIQFPSHKSKLLASRCE